MPEEPHSLRVPSKYSNLSSSSSWRSSSETPSASLINDGSGDVVIVSSALQSRNVEWSTRNLKASLPLRHEYARPASSSTRRAVPAASEAAQVSAAVNAARAIPAGHAVRVEHGVRALVAPPAEGELFLFVILNELLPRPSPLVVLGVALLLLRIEHRL